MVVLVLFVGTKKQAQDAIKTEAERCGMYYVNERWLRRYAYKLQDNPEPYCRDSKTIETMAEDGTFDVLPKKEVIELKKEWDKLREEPWRNQRNEENPRRYLYRRS